MSNDLANNKTHGQNASGADYASKVFEESSVCAISSILSTDSKPRKIFRSVVFLIFTIVFLYQCIALLCHVLQYPTIANVEILRPEYFLSPAFTFCNVNPIKRSKFCAIYPDNCTKPNEEFCNKNPRFCGTPDTQILAEDVFDFDELEDLFQLSHEAEDMVGYGNKEDPNLIGPLSRSNSHGWGIGACFTYYDRVDSPLDPVMKRRSPIGHVMFENIYFDPEENELIYPELNAGIMFEVHSPFEAVNPFQTGYFMKPGYHYRITVKLNQEELHPYDCVNYTEVWLKNNKTGYRSQQACKHKCIGDILLECFNCTETLVLYPYPNASLCKHMSEKPRIQEACENIELMVEKCIGQCVDECVETKFSYKIKESFLNRYALNAEKNESRQIRVHVDFLNADIQKISQKPQFKVIEIFSLIGGLLAFWIGLSMFQVVEVFDCIFQIGEHLFKKRSSGSENPAA